jgi:hypothetical protein
MRDAVLVVLPSATCLQGRPADALAMAEFARRLVVAALHGPAVAPLGDDRPAITVSGPRARMRRSGGGACGCRRPGATVERQRWYGERRSPIPGWPACVIMFLVVHR